jgi:hypothetical protein
MESHDITPPQPESHSRTVSHKRLLVGGAVVLGLIVIVFWATGFGRQLVQQAKYTGRAATFSGDSQKLKQTVIVPTLDSPCLPGKNVIWCSSFQLAWNEMKDKVIGAPLQVIGAEEIAARLNAAKQSSSDLDSKSFYVAGGSTKDGVIDKIKKDMAAKFPSHVLPDFSDVNNGIFAYSYLKANVPFKYPFEQAKLVFGDSQSEKTPVEAFGVWNLLERYDKIRKQVEILYCPQERERDRRIKECVIDLCKDSKPYQVIVAMVKPEGSLAESLEYVRLRVDDFKKSVDYERDSQLNRVDDLKIPEMFWRIDHRFRELIGRVVRNVDMPIVEAMQTMEFRLDRSGAVLESEAKYGVSAIPREFLFDRPFLIYMQKREADQPFFVMWVDNAELLVRR